MNCHVIARDHRLRWQIDVLLAQVDGGQGRPRIGPENCTWLIQKRHQDIEPAAGDLVEPSQPLNQHDAGLGHDSDRLGRNYQQHDRDKAEEQKGKKRSDWFHDRLPFTDYADYKASSIISAACRTISSAKVGPAICTPIGRPSFDFPAGTVTTGRSNTLNVCA